MIHRFICFALLFILFTECKKESDPPQEWIKADLFKNPTVDFRSAPFYALNDLLDTTELVKQIHGFKDAGFGGFFLHSRGGLLTQYMGNEWWDAMHVAMKTSKQIGLKTWFYDEDKWPSGFAGGEVPLISEEYHARCLSRIDKSDSIKKGDQLLFEDAKYKYICHKARMGNSWFNGTAYVDLLNPAMVKAFIDCAYKPYVENFGKEIGQTVPGIFTDEPQISPRVSGGKEGSVSFSPVVVDKFKEMHGYDIIPHVASLFDTTGNFEKIRFDYYKTISRCFEENFTKQIGDYCAKNKTIFTGHLNGEESFQSAMTNSGNSMVNYRHMQMPGMDQLGLNYIPLNIPRSVSSVANQYGISRRLSESYGISGHNMSFEDRKWLLDWLTQHGINYIVPHLSLYSMKGERKRDYPPNFSPAQPYWSYNKLFEDYTGRLCYVNTIGKYAADIVIIHPLETEYLGVKNNCYQQYDKLLDFLQKNHRNYDLGDEQILSEIGKVKEEKLRIGQMAYKVVLLPYMLEIRRSTLDILKQFKSKGGIIIACGRLPEYVDGKLAPGAIDSLKQICMFIQDTELKDVLSLISPAAYKIDGADNESLYTHHRIVEKGGVLQISNTSRLKEVDCELSFASPVSHVALWNPEDGTSMKLESDKDGNINLHFAATQTWIVSYGEASREANQKAIYKMPAIKTIEQKIAGQWQGQRLDPNALTLDFARYSSDNGKTYSKPEPVIGIHQRLGNMNYRGRLLLKFEAEVKDIPEKCSLVVEQPQLYQFFVNGAEIEFGNGGGYYRDHAFRVQDISGRLKAGTNELVLSLNYVAPEKASLDAMKRYGTEIESIYLIGDFAVSAVPSSEPMIASQKYDNKLLSEKPVYSFSSFSISKEISAFDNDLVKQGYPFYAGAFLLKNSFTLKEAPKDKKYYISFPAFEAIVMKVKVNGQEFPPLIYSPWEVEITGALKEGENQVEVTLINSLRNLLGPHHHTGGELKAVGPMSFTGNQGWPNVGGENDWYKLRLKGKTELWRDDYSMVPFGFLEPPVISTSLNINNENMF